MPTELLPPRNQAPDSPEHEPRPADRPSGQTPQQDNGAFRIATVSGIPIRIHWTFFLLLAWVAITGFGGGGRGSLGSVALVLALFGCVALHELGHALTAQRYGIRTRDIVLYPIGGVASLETMPRPRQELWIALAGPAVNVVIAAALYAVMLATGTPVVPLDMQQPQRPSFLVSLMWANVFLVVFNMIPAFPMDGGRVLRALIARVTTEANATAIAARIGQFLAILFGLLGLFSGNWILIFIAIFVYMGAGQEAAVSQAKAIMEGHRVQEAMLREFRALPVGTTLKEAGDALLAGSQQDFPVVHGEEVVGLLSRSALIRGLATEGPEAYVAGAMERDFHWARPDEYLEEVLTEMGSLQGGPLLIFEGETRDVKGLLGMVTQENLLEFLTLAQLRKQYQEAERSYLQR